MRIVLAVIVMLCGCDKKGAGSGANATAVGSGSAFGSGRAASKPVPVDLPKRSAPGTPEVLAQFDKACDGGTGIACYDSAMRRAMGMGATKDRVAAVVWLEKGCKL